VLLDIGMPPAVPVTKSRAGSRAEAWGKDALLVALTAGARTRIAGAQRKSGFDRQPDQADHGAGAAGAVRGPVRTSRGGPALRIVH